MKELVVAVKKLRIKWLLDHAVLIDLGREAFVVKWVVEFHDARCKLQDLLRRRVRQPSLRAALVGQAVVDDSRDEGCLGLSLSAVLELVDPLIIH